MARERSLLYMPNPRKLRLCSLLLTAGLVSHQSVRRGSELRQSGPHRTMVILRDQPARLRRDSSYVVQWQQPP